MMLLPLSYAYTETKLERQNVNLLNMKLMTAFNYWFI